MAAKALKSRLRGAAFKEAPQAGFGGTNVHAIGGRIQPSVPGVQQAEGFKPLRTREADLFCFPEEGGANVAGLQDILHRKTACQRRRFRVVLARLVRLSATPRYGSTLRGSPKSSGGPLKPEAVEQAQKDFNLAFKKQKKLP